MLLPLLGEINAGRKIMEVSELWGASKAFFLSWLQRESERPLVVIAATEEEAGTLLEDLRFFMRMKRIAGTETRETALLGFPVWGILPFEADSPDSRTIGERMLCLYRLISGTPGIYVMSLPALLQKILPWQLFADSVKTITAAAPIDPESLIAALVGTGYESASLVTRVGEFSRRGGIIDFFSPLHENPVRMEFFGDSIESLREFDPETQRSIAEIKEAVVLPVRELIINEMGIEQFSRRVDDEALIGQVRAGVIPPGGEFLAPFFYRMDSLFMYLPRNTLVALVEPDDLSKAIETQVQKIREGRQEELEEGRTLPEVSEL